MELVYNFTSTVNSSSPSLLSSCLWQGGIIFYYKSSFVFLLFFINLYLIFTFNKERSDKGLSVLQSGLGNTNLKRFFNNLVLFGGFLSTLITVKNELKDVQIGKLDQLMVEERENIRKSIDQDREIHQSLLNKIESNREELFKYHVEKAKMLGHNDRLLTLHKSIKDHIVSYQDKSSEPSTKLSELGILDQLIKQDTNKFGQELDSLILQIENPLNPSMSPAEGSSTPSTLPNGEEGDITDGLKDLKESSVFNFNIITSMDWFEGLNGIKKLAVSLILGKSVIFSALLSIIFIFYGNILIEKYDLVNRYPKLAKIIQLRRKFQKYYFNYYCGLILSVIVIEVAFGVTFLLL